MRAVGMAGKVAAGTQPAEQGTAGGHSQRILRPAQASKTNNGPQLAGLAAKTQLPTVLACLSPCSAGKWGSAGVLAAMKAGADLPTLSLPHLSPLPVTVPTHSLNL